MASDAPVDLVSDLTPEQRAAVEHGTGPLLILAGAGSGKTRVITRRVVHLMRSGVRAGQILAITFTNKAAGEMKNRVQQLAPGNRIWVSTFHKFGSMMLRQYSDRLNIDKTFTIFDVDDRNKLVKTALERANIDSIKFTPERLAGAISKAKNALQTPRYFAETAKDFFAQTVAKVYTEYEKLIRAANGMDFDDLLYLPALALMKNEELRAELDARFKYVMVDEYQDTNAAQYEIAKRLSIHNPNICVVGDPDQCLTPDTLVATPNGPRRIDGLKEGEIVLSGSGWAEMIPRPIEKVMVSQYRGRILRIRTDCGSEFRATPNHIGFARLIADPDQHFVYLMYKRGVGYRLGTTRGVRTSKDGMLLSGLQVRTNQEVADAVWIIRTCETPEEARFYEQYFSVKYGIPTMVFFCRGRNMAWTQDWIDKLYRDIDTETAATRLMKDCTVDPHYPHHRPGAVVRGDLARRQIQFTMFGDPRAKTGERWHEHRVQLITSGEELRERMKASGLPARPGNKGTWRIETSRKGYDDAQHLASRIAEQEEFEIVSRARLTPDKAFPFIPVAHIHPGMIVPVHRAGRIVEGRVASVEWGNYNGPVYDLSIPETRNFIAGGIAVHNSIYKWRGSDIKNIMDFERDYPSARVITLEQNYRSTKAILHSASNVIDRNTHRKKKRLITDNPAGEPVRVLMYDNGLDEAEGVVLRIKQHVAEKKFSYKDCAIFLRINALTRSLESAFVKHGVPFQIVRGLAFFDRKENKDVLAYLRLLQNPSDPVAFLRIVNEPARGIGKVSLDRLISWANENEMTLTTACGQVSRIVEIKGKAAVGLRDFFRLMTDLRSKLDSPLHELIREVLDKSGYKKMLTTSDSEDADRLANIEELITAAKQFYEEDTSRTLGDFLENSALAGDVDAWDENTDCVSVMTLHAAKGLEFPVVYMLACEQGLLPHNRSIESGKDDEIEEERRLCFVGMTRAMKELNLCHARMREFRGQTTYAIPSMFLDELPSDVERLDLSAGLNTARMALEQYRMGSTFGSGRPRPLPPIRQPVGDSNSGDDYSVGTVVQHTEYGLGQVTEVSGYGSLKRIKIRFPAAGEKTFVAEKVKLKIVKRP